MNTFPYPMPDAATVYDAVILADGDYPEAGLPATVLRNARHVVCCDGAADRYAAHGGTPSAIVGDGDSVSRATAWGISNPGGKPEMASASSSMAQRPEALPSRRKADFDVAPSMTAT